MTVLRAMLTILWVLAPASLAQASDAISIEEQFAQDAKDHGRALQDLYAMRGLNPMEMSDATVESVMRWLTSQRIDRSPGHPEGTSVLFYSHEGERLTIYLLDAQGLQAHHEVAISQGDLKDAVIGFRMDLNVDGIDRSRAPVWRGGEAEGQSVPVTRSIAEWDDPIDEILLPEQIAEKMHKVRHLVIVANGVIGTVPFAVLPLGDDGLVVERMSVTVAPSLFDLDQMIRPWRPELDYRNALLVGDPVVPASPDWDVPRLPGAMEEVELMATRSEGKVLLGEEATKAEVVRGMRRSNILYFAAHGVSNPREPLTGGFLMLSGASPEDAFLTASEVQKMRLRANLVVLSACQSGLGLNHDGGVIGLARSFQKAGVPRVVMSLWSVSDEATLYLMDRFQLEAKETFPAEALRLAMLAAREKYPDPALWGGFTLFGTPR